MTEQPAWLRRLLLRTAGWSPADGPLLVQNMINASALDLAEVCRPFLP